MENTNIEWATHTFNPWKGCQGVSPGCKHCYAKDLVERWGGDFSHRTRTTAGYWKKPLKWNRDAGAVDEVFNTPGPINSVLGPVARPRVFCASLADWLDDKVPIEWLAYLLALINKTPNLDWLLLTKRPQNWRDRIHAAGVLLHERGDVGAGSTGDMLVGWEQDQPPANVWIGTTVEDQTRADERIPELLKIPAKVRFLSCEPLLGPVSLDKLSRESNGSIYFDNALTGWRSHGAGGWTDPERIHWVIAGGESGPQARPMHPEWARSLRDQCQAAGVPFLFKQWGEWADAESCVGGDWKANQWSDGSMSARVGKKKAGRILDGREWTEFPTVEVAK